MFTRRLQTSTLFTLLFLLASADVWAFERTQTCVKEVIEDTDRLCLPGQTPRSITWENPCQTYFVQRNGSDDFQNNGKSINPELLQEIIASFDQWNRQDCTDFKAVYGGETCNNQPKKVDKFITGGNQNLVVWTEEGWPDRTSTAIAVTLVRVDRESGLIEDADIEVNGDFFNFSILDTALDQTELYDVRNVMTHEAGHFLGLAHEDTKPDTTMASEAVPGEIKKRDLTLDDIQGLCSIYPKQGFGTCTPKKLQDTSCEKDYTGRPGCHTAESPGRPPAAVLTLVALALVGLIRRRRR